MGILGRIVSHALVLSISLALLKRSGAVRVESRALRSPAARRALEAGVGPRSRLVARGAGSVERA